jgi:hypothetical protein
MDIIDQANQQADLLLQLQLNEAKRTKPGPLPTGACLYCGEDVAPGRRWCDADCCSAWEKEQRNAPKV